MTFLDKTQRKRVSHEEWEQVAGSGQGQSAAPGRVTVKTEVPIRGLVPQTLQHPGWLTQMRGLVEESFTDPS